MGPAWSRRRPGSRRGWRGEELQETEDVREEGVLMNQDVPKKSPDLSGLVRRLREGEQEQLKTSTPRRKFN